MRRGGVGREGGGGAGSDRGTGVLQGGWVGRLTMEVTKL
jgi:hypothetical protein